jgi:outer membrane protein insertion porin family
MLLGNFELRLPVEDSFSLVLFYDTGRAWDSRDGESMSFSDLADNYGFGVRVKTPIGNIRLDVAEGDEETRTIFSMGELF